MATCKDCGIRISIFEGGGKCSECQILESQMRKIAMRQGPEAADQFIRERSANRDAANRKDAEDRAAISAVMLSTEVASDLKIIERIDVITAECAYGMTIFKDLFASIRDVVGGRSEAVQKTMRDARKTALFELRKEAHALGANAVVGVDLDYVELTGAGNMVMLVASGTAVRIAPSDLP